MKKIIVTLSFIVCILFTHTGCNNGTDASTDAAKKDTTLNSDSIKVDPENFSDPH